MMQTLHASFDTQAENYDERVGFSSELCAAIADTISDITQPADNDVIIELGCGTGQIGVWLEKLQGEYCGFDLSAGMLKEFKKNYTENKVDVIQADAGKFWPFKDHSVKVIFSSRALHLIDIEHAVEEIFRVGKDRNVYLFIGRSERVQDGWEKALRKKLHELVKECGLTPKDGKKYLKRMSQLCEARGAQVLEPVEVDSWFTPATMEEKLKSWEQKEGLAGIQPRQDVKDEILKKLWSWAENQYGLPLPSGTRKRYILYGFKLS